jgi:uncharacterized membrane protein
MSTGFYEILPFFAGIGFGLISGSEIAMLTVAASTKYKWRRAWTITLAGLVTMIPVGAAIYYFFTVLPQMLLGLAAGAVIFLIGAYFLFKGSTNAGEEHEEESRISAGMLGIYSGVVLEGIEILTVVVSLGAVTGELAPSVLGLLIGWSIPLAAVRFLKPLIERMEERFIKIAVGLIMMVIAGSLILLHLP